MKWIYQDHGSIKAADLTYPLCDHIQQFQLLSLPLVPIIQASQKFLEIQWSSLFSQWLSNSSPVSEFGQHTREEDSWDFRKTKGFPTVLGIYSVFLIDQYLNSPFLKDMPWCICFSQDRTLPHAAKSKKVEVCPPLLLWQPGYSTNQRPFSRTLNLKVGTQRQQDSQRTRTHGTGCGQGKMSMLTSDELSVVAV